MSVLVPEILRTSKLENLSTAITTRPTTRVVEGPAGLSVGKSTTTLLPVSCSTNDPSGSLRTTNATPFDGKVTVFPLLTFVNVNEGPVPPLMTSPLVSLASWRGFVKLPPVPDTSKPNEHASPAGNVGLSTSAPATDAVRMTLTAARTLASTKLQLLLEYRISPIPPSMVDDARPCLSVGCIVAMFHRFVNRASCPTRTFAGTAVPVTNDAHRSATRSWRHFLGLPLSPDRPSGNHSRALFRIAKTGRGHPRLPLSDAWRSVQRSCRPVRHRRRWCSSSRRRALSAGHLVRRCRPQSGLTASGRGRRGGGVNSCRFVMPSTLRSQAEQHEDQRRHGRWREQTTSPIIDGGVCGVRRCASASPGLCS